MELYRALRVARRDLVAFVGAGGKTTAMLRLANELVAAGYNVVVTTTTHIYPPAGGQPLIVSSDESDLCQRVREALEQSRLVVVASERTQTPEGTKLVGVRPEVTAALRHEAGADVVLVEADGARGRLLKAPAAHEPVIPTTSTLVVPLAGLSVIGCPLSPEAVHRPEGVAALTGLQPGEPITLKAVATLLSHPQGGLKGVPAGARVIALLNQADDAGRFQAGQALAGLLLQAQRFEAVCIGHVTRADQPVGERHDRVAAVILAAGAGRRFGGLKQLALWRGQPLLGHVIEAVLASQVREVVVVVGYEADRVSAFVRARWPKLRIVVNPNWPQGQSTSMQAGLQALSPESAAALFVLADQPRLSAGVINALIQRRRETLAPIIVPTYGGQRGNPVLFDRALFPELMAVTGDVGGRGLIQTYADQVAWLPLSAGAAPGDVDRLEDLVEA